MNPLPLAAIGADLLFFEKLDEVCSNVKIKKLDILSHTVNEECAAKQRHR